MENVETLKIQFSKVWPHLGERERRLVAAFEAKRIGHGGVSLVSIACGLSRVTITKGIKELDEPPIAEGRVHKPGAGRPRLEILDPELTSDLENILEYNTRGDPETPKLWTCKSTRTLAAELEKLGHRVGHDKVSRLLHSLGYSLQSNKKSEEGADHPDRDAQFRFIKCLIKFHISVGNPVISVDTKKKELVGNYYNKGQQWRIKKNPLKVQGHDFPNPSIPRALPYGIYDIGLNSGFVNIGTDHDTAAFSVASIRGWWINSGQCEYPNISKLLITADSGGSNGARLRTWKFELQKLADELMVPIQISHFPPGTSKWNKIEHRLFSFISSNWRGEPLIDYETIVNLINNTTTSKGLSVQCRLDHTKYPIGIKITNAEMEQVNLVRSEFHGEWNYMVLPHDYKM
jgi:transposase